MHAFLDDRPIDAERPTLAGVLARGAAMAEESGRIIVEVRVDGKDVDGAELESPPEDDLGDVEVRLTSADPGTVAGEALRDAAAQLEATRERQRECAELIQVGKITDAMNALAECLGDWQAARSVVGSVMQLTEVGTPGGGETIEDLAVRLDELKAALTAQDWSTVTDLLAYDLDEEAARWVEMLGEMRRSIEGA